MQEVIIVAIAVIAVLLILCCYKSKKPKENYSFGTSSCPCNSNDKNKLSLNMSLSSSQPQVVSMQPPSQLHTMYGGYGGINHINEDHPAHHDFSAYHDMNNAYSGYSFLEGARPATNRTIKFANDSTTYGVIHPAANPREFLGFHGKLPSVSFSPVGVV